MNGNRCMNNVYAKNEENTFQTKMGMYMVLLGIGVSLALVVFQIFMK